MCCLQPINIHNKAKSYNLDIWFFIFCNSGEKHEKRFFQPVAIIVVSHLGSM